YSHQHLPFERLIEELRLPRDLSRAPLVQAVLVLLNEAQPKLELPRIESRLVPSYSGSAKFELSLLLSETGAQLEGWLEYNADLFDAATMDRLAAGLVQLARDVTADPDGPIALTGAAAHADEAPGQALVRPAGIPAVRLPDVGRGA